MIDLLFIKMCSTPGVSERTLWEIIRVESGFNEIAINVNRTDMKITKPKTITDAAETARSLSTHGLNFDLGIMQINSKNLARLGLTFESAFDPCANIRAGSTILKENYNRSTESLGEGQAALGAALSAYNTGNFKAGYSNGYVQKVYGNKIVLKREKAPEDAVTEDNYPYYETGE